MSDSRVNVFGGLVLRFYMLVCKCSSHASQAPPFRCCSLFAVGDGCFNGGRSSRVLVRTTLRISLIAEVLLFLGALMRIDSLRKRDWQCNSTFNVIRH
jgi:hypothetical protein